MADFQDKSESAGPDQPMVGDVQEATHASPQPAPARKTDASESSDYSDAISQGMVMTQIIQEQGALSRRLETLRDAVIKLGERLTNVETALEDKPGRWWMTGALATAVITTVALFIAVASPKEFLLLLIELAR